VCRSYQNVNRACTCSHRGVFHCWVTTPKWTVLHGAQAGNVLTQNGRVGTMADGERKTQAEPEHGMM
jgi:hypothetical protein